jgi:hypothetical protein
MIVQRPRQLDMFEPLPTNSPVTGTLVKLDRYGDRVQPCHENIAVVAAGSGPHGAALLCSACGAHRGWLFKSTIRFLERTMQLYGRHDGMPVIRNTEQTGAP